MILKTDNPEIKSFFPLIFHKPVTCREGTVTVDTVPQISETVVLHSFENLPWRSPNIFLFPPGCTKPSQVLLYLFPDKDNLHFWRL